MNQSDILATLAGHYLFAPLTPEVRLDIVKHSRVLNLAADSLVFQKDSLAASFYLILSGGVRLYFSAPDGKEKTVRIFEAVSSFAEALMFMKRDGYPANAMTIAPSTLLAIDSRYYRELIVKNGELAVALLGHCCEHIHALSRQIEMLSVLDARSRLLEYLRQQLSPAAKTPVELQIPMNKKELAEFLAIRPETLSRLLRQLENERILQWNAEAAVVLDPQAVHRLM